MKRVMAGIGFYVVSVFACCLSAALGVNPWYPMIGALVATFGTVYIVFGDE